MAETVLAKMAVEIAANTAQFTRSLQNTESRLAGFSNELKSIGNTIGIAFGVGAVTSFAFEVAKLAGEAEGVRAAFDQLPQSEALMSRLKDATAGTVSELELMKRTVQATNFGISLESLPKLLEFAAVRAQQTGQSVDYLVDSIVTGIGRKSPLILDNLGISAVKLKDQMGGVSLATAEIGDVANAVGRIAEEELEKMGSLSENTATKVARVSASWENLKVALGNAANSSGVLSKSLNILTNTLNSVSGDQFTRGFNELLANMGKGSEQLEKFAAAGGKIDLSWQDLLAQGFVRTEEAARKYEKILAEIAKRQSDLAKTKIEIDPATGLPVGGGTRWSATVAQQQIQSLESLREKVKQLNEQFDQADINDQKRLTNIGAEIIAVNEQIKKLEELRKARKASELVVPDTVDAYQAALADLNKELENTNVKDTSRLRVLSAQIAGYQEAIARVEALKKSFQGLSGITVPVPDLKPLLDPLKTIRETDGTITWSRTITATEEMVKRFEERLSRLPKIVQQTQETLSTIDLTGPITASISGLAEALGNAAVGVGNFGEDILKIVASFGKQLGQILIAEGVALLAAKFALKNPYTAIAAGVALVAISSAMSSSISKAHSNTIGGGGTPATTRVNERNISTSSNEAQDVKVTGNIVLRGQDLYVALKNYEDNNRFTRASG